MLVEKCFLLLFLIGVLCQVGHVDKKLDLSCILNHLITALINFLYQLDFLLLLKGVCNFFCDCYLIRFC